MGIFWKCKPKRPVRLQQQCLVCLLYVSEFILTKNYRIFWCLVDKLRANCQIFLCFGSEAFLSCIEWSLISVAYFPQYQKIISDEILAVIGAQRIPELKDEPRIPFTLAFLNEVLRWKTVFPFNFMRR